MRLMKNRIVIFDAEQKVDTVLVARRWRRANVGANYKKKYNDCQRRYCHLSQ